MQYESGIISAIRKSCFYIGVKVVFYKHLLSGLTARTLSLIMENFTMNIHKKKLIWGFIILIVLLLFGYFDYYLWRLLSAGAGIQAKIMCSSVFISNRTPESVLNEDLHHKVNYIRLEVDAVNQSVTATAFGIITRQAVYREGLGSTLLAGLSREQLLSQTKVDYRKKPSRQKGLPWPDGDSLPDDELPPGIDSNKLNAVLETAFSEPDPTCLCRTRAVVVLYDGKLIKERYAPGFTHETPLFGYGMTKSVINALTGILVGEGKLKIDEPVTIPEWSGPGDPRSAITLDQLLRMSSGLEFDDSKTPLTDSIIMFGSADMASYAANKPLEAAPDTKFLDSNGTSNIISRIIKETVVASDIDYFLFPRQALFDRIGMRSAVIEPDASGTFVGSTYLYATARDWARFGLLYLNDGVWEGERILPEGWVDYSRTPTPSNPYGDYGAHFWLKAIFEQKGKEVERFHLPPDTFFALGHDGQSLTIIPSRKLVVVRLGLTQNPDAWNLDSFIAGILEALPE